MNFVKVDEVSRRTCAKASSKEYIRLFDEFIASGFDVAMLTDIPEGRDPQKLRSTLAASAKRYGYKIQVAYRKEKVYLIREISNQEEEVP